MGEKKIKLFQVEEPRSKLDLDSPEPLTLEDVLEIVRLEKPYGVIVQYGGQTPLKLANELEEEMFKLGLSYK